MLLTHPWQVTHRELNRRNLKGRTRALEEWIAAGLVHCTGRRSWNTYALDPGARHADQVIDAYARAMMGPWRDIQRAMAQMEAQHASERTAATELADALINAPCSSDTQAQIAGTVAAHISATRAIRTIADGTYTLSALRAQVERSGICWADVTTRAGAMLADADAQAAARDAADQAAQAALDPEADPLGGDA